MSIGLISIDSVSEELYHELVLKVSVERSRQLAGFCCINRYRSLVGELLARRMVEEMTGISSMEIEYGILPGGKPVVMKPGGVWYNISHSGSLVACVTDSAPVGIDVQTSVRNPRKIIRRCLSEQEMAETENMTEEQLTVYMSRIWARKESFLKMTGTGLRTPMEQFRFETEPSGAVFRDGTVIPCSLYDIKPETGYYLSVCYEREVQQQERMVTWWEPHKLR